MKARDGNDGRAASRDVDDVFRHLGGAVHGYLRAGGAVDSENLLGDVFVDVMKALPRFRGDDAALRRWVFSIAHNRLVDERRRVARWKRLRAHPQASFVAPTEPFDADLEAALARLTPDQRDVVVLRFVADLSVASVAQMLGKPTGAVKALQHRALDRLQRELGAHTTATAS